MRTRFSAYAKGRGLYVVKTTRRRIQSSGSKTEGGEGGERRRRGTWRRTRVKKCAFTIWTSFARVKGKRRIWRARASRGFRYKCRVVRQQGFNELPEEQHAELRRVAREGAALGEVCNLRRYSGIDVDYFFCNVTATRV